MSNNLDWYHDLGILMEALFRGTPFEATVEPDPYRQAVPRDDYCRNPGAADLPVCRQMGRCSDRPGGLSPRRARGCRRRKGLSPPEMREIRELLDRQLRDGELN